MNIACGQMCSVAVVDNGEVRRLFHVSFIKTCLPYRSVSCQHDMFLTRELDHFSNLGALCVTFSLRSTSGATMETGSSESAAMATSQPPAESQLCKAFVSSGYVRCWFACAYF